MSHPVNFDVMPPEGARDRLTVLLRPILAFPHVVLVGGPFLGLLGAGYRTGVFGLLAIVIAFLDWCAILITGQPLAGLQALKISYLHWRARVLAYCAFLTDQYPPFGEDAYPATLTLPDPPAERDRLGVGVRPLLVLPHLVVLAVLLVAWLFVALYTWLAIVVTGRHAPELWRFGRDVMRYVLRVEAYILLIHDEFPPFALSSETGPSFSVTADRTAGA